MTKAAIQTGHRNAIVTFSGVCSSNPSPRNFCEDATGRYSRLKQPSDLNYGTHHFFSLFPQVEPIPFKMSVKLTPPTPPPVLPVSPLPAEPPPMLRPDEPRARVSGRFVVGREPEPRPEEEASLARAPPDPTGPVAPAVDSRDGCATLDFFR